MYMLSISTAQGVANINSSIPSYFVNKKLVGLVVIQKYFAQKTSG